VLVAWLIVSESATRLPFDETMMVLLEVQDGRVIVENIGYVRGLDGIEAEARSAWLIDFRDGEQIWLMLYQTKQEALEAAGLSG
jgi:hypothetical protein